MSEIWNIKNIHFILPGYEHRVTTPVNPAAHLLPEAENAFLLNFIFGLFYYNIKKSVCQKVGLFYQGRRLIRLNYVLFVSAQAQKKSCRGACKQLFCFKNQALTCLSSPSMVPRTCSLSSAKSKPVQIPMESRTESCGWNCLKILK